MSFIEKVRGLWNRMIGNSTQRTAIANKLNVQIATSARMDVAIQEWEQLYEGNPPWMGGEDQVQTLNLPSTIAEEFSRLILTEFSFTADGESARAGFINENTKHFITTLSDTVERWAALGGIALKPYVTGEDENGKPTGLTVDVVPANRFYPTAYDSNKNVTGAVFVETKRKGDYLYTRLEHHNLEGNKYTVQNRAYRSERLNSALTEDDNVIANTPFAEPVQLDEVPEWAGIEPDVTISGIVKPLFIYIRTPRGNTTDPGSPLGSSVYERALDVLREVDKQYSRILWEYKSKETAIEADETLFRSDQNGRPIIPAGQERLFRTYDHGNSEKSLFQVFSPEIRDSSLFNGLNKLLRQVEWNCGLAYGTISDINTGANAAERTATELKVSRQRSYTTVSKMQNALEAGLRQLMDAINITCDLYGICPGEAPEVTIYFGDGVLEDVDKEYTRRWAMVLAGKLKVEKFYSWYFGCSEEEAKEMIPDEPGLMFPPIE